MRINYFIYFITALTLLSACKNKSGEPFVLEGMIKGAEDKIVMIETMNFPSINQYPKYILIDSVRADKKGNFKIENYLPERMICRITVQGSDYNYYIVSLHNEHMMIEADINKQLKPEITGSAQTSILYTFIDAMRELNLSQLPISDSISKYEITRNDSMLTIYQAKRTEAQLLYKQKLMQFIDTTSEISNAIIGLEGLTFKEDFDYIKNYGHRLRSGEDSSSIYVKELIAKIEMQEQLLASTFIGRPATDIIQPDPTGNPLKLSDLKGKVVLLDFWASWCGPCRRENPNVVKVYEKFKDKGFTIFSVSLDTDKNKWIAAIDQDKLIWNTHVSVLNDSDNQAALDYHIRGIPMSYLIDRNGIIVAENLRGAELEAELIKLLNQ